MDDRPNGTYWTRKRALVEHALASMSGTAAKVMHLLEQRANAATGVIERIGASELGAAIGSDRKSVRAALAELETAGCLQQELAGPGRGNKRSLRLLAPVGVAAAPLFDGHDGPASGPAKGGEMPPFEVSEKGAKFPTKGGESPPFYGGKGGEIPHKRGQNTPRYNVLTPNTPPTPAHPSPPPPPPGAEEEAFRKRVALLQQRGIFPDQARRYARVFSDQQLAEHWRDINGNPRIRKKGGAYANRLKQFLPG